MNFHRGCLLQRAQLLSLACEYVEFLDRKHCLDKAFLSQAVFSPGALAFVPMSCQNFKSPLTHKLSPLGLK